MVLSRNHFSCFYFLLRHGTAARAHRHTQTHQPELCLTNDAILFSEDSALPGALGRAVVAPLHGHVMWTWTFCEVHNTKEDEDEQREMVTSRRNQD